MLSHLYLARVGVEKIIFQSCAFRGASYCCSSSFRRIACIVVMQQSTPFDMMLCDDGADLADVSLPATCTLLHVLLCFVMLAFMCFGS